jgi:glycosyltransferase involved in cell wall biosynthesis
MWDVASSQRVNWFVANSHHVSDRIRKYYNRDSVVIYPPVNTDFYHPAREQDDYFLLVSALVPYKKVDLAIRTFNRMQKPLLIIGNGPEEKSLKALAGPTVRFMDYQDPPQLLTYYQKCRSLIFPGEEDFGIVPVEAQACGRPVIAFGHGGVRETVIGYNGSNERECSGVFFELQTEDELEKAVLKSLNVHWDSDFISHHARRFGSGRFMQEMKTFLNEKLTEFQDR